MSIWRRISVHSAALGLLVSPAAAQTNGPEKDPFAEESVSISATAAVPSPAASNAPPDQNRFLEAQSTLDGATGLVRLVAADSGGTGTFRLGVMESYFTGTSFLCDPVCGLPGKAPTRKSDDASQIATRLLLSATPADFLEAYAALRFQSTSNDQGDPKAIQIVGDTTLGVKAFMPAAPDRILSFGGDARLVMLSSPGGVGLDAASFGIRALGTADFTRRAQESDRIPLRLHVNAGYLFDGSGNLADDIEGARAKVLGGPQRITRIERFAHDVNRVDSFRTGLGAEVPIRWIRPFAEWTIDLPVNRQQHRCRILARSPGDACLTHIDFAGVPSRVTIGARVYPWLSSWLEGLAFLAAFDIGTGATSSFIEEVRPELPWALHVGLAYAVDTAPRAPAGETRVVEKVVPAPPPPERYIDGTVVRAGKETEPIAGAVVRYVGRPFTGMVTDEQGKFRTRHLDPGEYKLAVTADGYRDTECSATIPEDKPPADGGKSPTGAAAPPAGPPAPVVAQASCQLEALPRTATITGVVRDAETTVFVGGANVSITDPLGRNLTLQTDAEGAFRFGNVPAGKSKLTIEADGYLRSVTELSLEPRHDVSTEIGLYARPKTPNVVVTPTEIKLKKEVHFLHGSAELLPDSMAILEEVADVLRSKPDIGPIEIQGHTDDSGTPEYNLKLSADRANAVRDVLVTNGVDGSRLTSHGYGQEKPLVPNTTPKNRAKNRRVQLVIQK